MKLGSIDLGKVRTGIAISDDTGYLASPFCVLVEKDRLNLLEKIKKIVDENNIVKIIVGLPKNMDGSEGESAKSAIEFSDLLREHTNLPVVMMDERMTTMSAHNYLNVVNKRGKKRKEIIDSVAATIILQDYLDLMKNKKEV